MSPGGACAATPALGRSGAERAADVPWRQERPALRLLELGEHRAHLLLGAALERANTRLRQGEAQVLAPCVGGRVGACQQALRCKAFEDAAQVAAIEPSHPPAAPHDARTMRDLVHHPHLGERVRTVEKPRASTPMRRV